LFTLLHIPYLLFVLLIYLLINFQFIEQ
jgi:hypothetical protein